MIFLLLAAATQLGAVMPPIPFESRGGGTQVLMGDDLIVEFRNNRHMRFRATNRNDLWVGSEKKPMDLCWAYADPGINDFVFRTVQTRRTPGGFEVRIEEYKPSSLPVFPTPADGGSRNDPNFAYYESNTVWVPLKNGAQQRIAIDTSLHPWRNQFLAGALSMGLDASLFKAVRIRESFVLRLNADFFNVLNAPGIPQPGANGIVNMRNSAQAARQLPLA